MVQVGVVLVILCLGLVLMVELEGILWEQLPQKMVESIQAEVVEVVEDLLMQVLADQGL
jgi:hypothetical protein